MIFFASLALEWPTSRRFYSCQADGPSIRTFTFFLCSAHYHRWPSCTQGITLHDGKDEALFTVASGDASPADTWSKQIRDCVRVQRQWCCSTVSTFPFSFVDVVELPYLVRLMYRWLPSGFNFPGDISNFVIAFLKTRLM